MSSRIILKRKNSRTWLREFAGMCISTMNMRCLSPSSRGKMIHLTALIELKMSQGSHIFNAGCMPDCFLLVSRRWGGSWFRSRARYSESAKFNKRGTFAQSLPYKTKELGPQGILQLLLRQLKNIAWTQRQIDV